MKKVDVTLSASYNAIGQQLTYVDQNRTTHTYAYDLMGRRITDAVAVYSGNPQGVDTSVLRQAIAFDTGGRPYQSTQYTAASGGSVVNQVQDVYNGPGQLTTEYQAHGGTVSLSSPISPNVQYSWNLMASGANNSRLLNMTYPNGRQLNYGYNAGLDATISRVSDLDDNAGTDHGTNLEDYDYLGLGTIIERDHPYPGSILSYAKQTGDTAYIGYPSTYGDGGDEYTGLDRFGRVIDQYWVVPGSPPTAKDRYQYAYDRDGNALYKNNLLHANLSELYHNNAAASGDNATAYDNLNRVQNFRRGTLTVSTSDYNGSSGQGSLDTVTTGHLETGLTSYIDNWSLDALGNWSSLATDGGSAVDRTHNSKNEVTAITGLTSPTFDGNGNTTKDQANQTYTYDAWNRQITVTSSTPTLLATYVYDARGWRVQEIHSGTTTDCYFSNQWQVIEEDQSSTVTNQYVWSLAYVDVLVVRDDNSSNGSFGKTSSGLGRRVYVAQDANWNTTDLISNTDSSEERFVYDPYGNEHTLNGSGTATTEAYAWNYLHQGGRYDPATGIYNQRGRDYSPVLGRWMQEEPSRAKYVDGPDLYLDELDAPVTNLDPNGTDCRIRSRCFLMGHCGLEVDDPGSGVTDINGNGPGGVPLPVMISDPILGGTGKAPPPGIRFGNPAKPKFGDIIFKGPWLTLPQTTCDCIASNQNLQNFNNNDNVPYHTLGTNSNWALKCFLKDCGITLGWGLLGSPPGWNDSTPCPCIKKNSCQ